MLETSLTPDRGWMGDRRRGASLGRADVNRRSADYIANLGKDIARLAETLASFAEGRFSGNFESERQEAVHVASLNAKLAAMRDELALLERVKEQPPKFRMREIRLDSGGYDRGGAYWGRGGYLWEAFTDDGTLYMTGRVMMFSPERHAAKSRLAERGIDWPMPWQMYREAAKAKILADFPDAKFYR